MKKWLIILLLAYGFYELVQYVDHKMNVEFFDEFYTRNYLKHEEPNWWKKLAEKFDSWVSDDDKEEREKAIYK